MHEIGHVLGMNAQLNAGQVVTEGAERLRPFQSINILPEGTAEDSAAPE